MGPGGVGAGGVITSYSIHYTKLYDAPPSAALSWLQAAKPANTPLGIETKAFPIGVHETPSSPTNALKKSPARTIRSQVGNIGRD